MNFLAAKINIKNNNHGESDDGGGDQYGANDDAGSNNNGGSATQTLVRPKQQVKEPPLFKVVLLNDDFTPMDFVVHILQRFFKKELEEATQIMTQVHKQGAGVAGIYSYEIAETKTYLVNDYARKNQHPLKCVMEKVSP
ncbi:MAG: ATP-dependent Clp protease adapter ClpS [Bdellovibrionales bacterium]